MGSNSELDEKNFIQERGPRYIWIFLVLFLATLALIWGGNLWRERIQKEQLANQPFFQVTNRDFSLFLWQFPEYMRSHSDLSEAYLPHFHTRDEVHVIPELADEYVSAPAEILYRYHTWDRLLGQTLISLPISGEGLILFLQENPEWLPQYWKGAPPEYRELVESLEEGNEYSEKLPLKVRLAYRGWLNYSQDWEKIHQFLPKKEQVNAFLKRYPNYARNYWRNLFPSYLTHLNEKGPLTNADFPYFLKGALYDFSLTTTNPSG